MIFDRTFAVKALLAVCALLPGVAQAGPAVQDGKGGPFQAAAATTQAGADVQFRALFQSWKQMDPTEARQMVAVPSARPVASMSLTSNFGVRSDPFRGTAAMHAGVDIPGPIGTPIYATADGVVQRAGWANGYGNLVELSHGGGISTRYGHLSSFVVAPGTRVKRGQLIARMGSTGRSTGSHLHYEVRLDGRAVNPLPFIQTADYSAAIRPQDMQVIGNGRSDLED